MTNADHQPPVIRLRLAAILLVTTLMVAVLGGIRSESAHVVPLFGRLDILAFALIFAVPLAIYVADKLESLSSLRKTALGAALWMVAGLFFCLVPALTTGNGHGEIMLMLWRGVVVVPLLIGVVMVCNLLPRRSARFDIDVPEWAIHLGLVALALVVPAVYADAVADGIRANLRQALENQRLALAYHQAQQLRQLKPEWSVDETPVARLERELEQAVVALTNEAAVPLSNQASVAEIGRRVTILVQLEKNRQALRLVEPLTKGQQIHPVALDFYALCYQRLGRPRESLQAYQNALQYWKDQAGSPAQARGLASAYKGIGFAARRLENRSLEEKAYHRLVKVAPTAESHFLLARCYREHQKAELAAEHAAMAMELDPLFSDEAEAMLSALSMDHFGCLQIPRR